MWNMPHKNLLLDDLTMRFRHNKFSLLYHRCNYLRRNWSYRHPRLQHIYPLSMSNSNYLRYRFRPHYNYTYYWFRLNSWRFRPWSDVSYCAFRHSIHLPRRHSNHLQRIALRRHPRSRHICPPLSLNSNRLYWCYLPHCADIYHSLPCCTK